MVKSLTSGRPDFPVLFDRLRTVYISAGKERHTAVLDNFQNRKEAICRKLGVIRPADIERIASKFRPR